MGLKNVWRGVVNTIVTITLFLMGFFTFLVIVCALTVIACVSTILFEVSQGWNKLKQLFERSHNG
jgi:hypothetical protein